jgi:hypothetical protein
MSCPKRKAGSLTCVHSFSGKKCCALQRVMTIIEEDEMKLQILQAHNKIMEDLSLRFVRLLGHVPGLTDVGMWKLKSEFTIDGGQTVFKWCQCPMVYRFGCKVQINVYDGPAYTCWRCAASTMRTVTVTLRIRKSRSISASNSFKRFILVSVWHHSRVPEHFATISQISVWRSKLILFKLRNVCRQVAKF